MRLISVEKCVEGMILAKTIYSQNGQNLLREGVTLTTSMLKKLLDLNITVLYIKDKRTDDVKVEEAISEEVKNASIVAIKDEFTKMMKSKDLTAFSQNKNFSKSFANVVNNMIKEIMNNKGTTNFLMEVYAFDHYVFQHSFNVTFYSLILAQALGLNDKQLFEIGMGAVLHDVGKLSIPIEILSKPDKLTAEEFKIMKEHTTFGFELLRRNHEIPLLTAHCAFQHHERIDGSGYPRGIQGKEIHLYAKIIGIADVYDALTTNRCYRKAMLPHEAIEIIYAGSGKQFDYEMVNTFKSVIILYPTGTVVKLNDGTAGLIVGQNRKLPARPIIRIIQDNQGVEINNILEIDLSKNLTLMIESCQIE